RPVGGCVRPQPAAESAGWRLRASAAGCVRPRPAAESAGWRLPSDFGSCSGAAGGSRARLAKTR
ncbi:hypothetical protein T492DRAFT_896121, partial [Pavlovales sp. CCMP2436]